MPVTDRSPVDFLPPPSFSNGGGNLIRCKSSPKSNAPSFQSPEAFEKPTFWLVFCSVVSFSVMLLIGYVRDIFHAFGLFCDPCPLDLPRHRV